MIVKKQPEFSNPSSGFMASYMKFLQGVRDTSPPPQNRAGRKAAWSKTKIYQPPDPPKSLDTTNSASVSNNAATSGNGGVISSNCVSSSSDAQRKDSKTKESVRVYDPQDDPRYFPLPKSVDKRKSFADSDDEFESSEGEKDEKVAQKEKTSVKLKEKDKGKEKYKGSDKDKTREKGREKGKDKSRSKSDSKSSKSTLKSSDTPAQVTSLAATQGEPIASKSSEKGEKNEKGRKGRAAKSERSSSKRKHEQDDEDDPLLIPPRRETSRRKAKEKIRMKLLDRHDNVDEEFEADEPEYADSDSDPAWTPAAKDSSDEDSQTRRRMSRRPRSLPSTRKRARLMSSQDDDDYTSNDSQDTTTDESQSKRGQFLNNRSTIKGSRGRPRSLALVSPPSPPPMAVDEPSVTSNEGNDPSQNELSDGEIKSGEFVVLKIDLGKENPPIWRIDGKTLLQKYEAFEQNGKTLYRNISTYSGWTPQNRHVYQQVNVKFRVQNRLETIVELVNDEVNMEEEDIVDKSMKDTAKYQDNFEVYIQTLISQALDSNFLTEIFQEQDDYFLSNVKTVDDITEERKCRFLKVAQWKDGLQTIIGTWPCFNVIIDLPAEEKKDQLCAACDKSQISVRVQMYGQPYNSTTLEGCQPDPNVANKKDFLLCAVCITRVELYNKVSHQKYLMYIECAKRVAEKRAKDPEKDTTVILNELLADESWLNQLFQSVRSSWAEIDKLEYQARNSIS